MLQVRWRSIRPGSGYEVRLSTEDRWDPITPEWIDRVLDAGAVVEWVEPRVT